MTTEALPVRTGDTRRRLTATLTRPPRGPEPERYILAIPYPIEDHDRDGGTAPPIGLLKRMAAMDHHDTAVDLGCRYLGKPEVTVHHGDQPSITVLAPVEVVSWTPEHIEARIPFLERGTTTHLNRRKP